MASVPVALLNGAHSAMIPLVPIVNPYIGSVYIHWYMLIYTKNVVLWWICVAPIGIVSGYYTTTNSIKSKHENNIFEVNPAPPLDTTMIGTSNDEHLTVFSLNANNWSVMEQLEQVLTIRRIQTSNSAPKTMCVDEFHQNQGISPPSWSVFAKWLFKITDIQGQNSTSPNT